MNIEETILRLQLLMTYGQTNWVREAARDAIKIIKELSCNNGELQICKNTLINNSNKTGRNCNV